MSMPSRRASAELTAIGFNFSPSMAEDLTTSSVEEIYREVFTAICAANKAINRRKPRHDR